MQLKRIYDHSSGKPVLTHVKVKTSPDIQKFSTKIVEQMTAAGVMSLGGGKITLKTGEDGLGLSYAIVRGPGLYCAHCNESQGDSRSAAEHVAKAHAGVKSPDPNNPSGYRRDNFYLGKKETAAKPKEKK